MKPVLITIGSQPISTFGFFLLLGLIFASFTIWRIIKAYDLNEERTIDLLLLTFAGGFVLARVYYILFHLTQFDDFIKFILVNRYPGLSFWGGLIGGILTLKLISQRFKMHFWQVADIGIVGVFIGLFFSSIGCLLGSCEYGLPSNLPFAVPQAGLIDKRFPLQFFEGFTYLILFFYLWKAVLRFHFSGQILARGLVLLGLVKFITELYRGDQIKLIGGLPLGLVWSLLLIIFGIWIYYVQGRKSLVHDLKMLLAVFIDSNRRHILISKIRKNWYNLSIDWKLSIARFRRNLFKVLNVKSNPTKF